MSVVGSAIIGTLVSIAAKVGAKQVEKYLGKGAGGFAGTIIEAIAESAGVPVPELGTVPGTALEQAVLAVEEQTPELVMAYTAQQAEANRLMLAEMDKGPTWTWAWRPGGMWMFLALIVYLVAIVPLINLFCALLGTSAKIDLVVDVAVFGAWLLAFLGLYMGGNTTLRIAERWKQVREAQAK